MAEKFVNILDAPYSRRGSYLAFAGDNYGEDVFGKNSLWLANCRSLGFNMADIQAKSGFRQLRLEAVKNGMPLACEIFTTPYEVILKTREGEIRFCIGERSLVMARGEDGLTLRVNMLPGFLSSGAVDMMDPLHRRLLSFHMSRLLLTPIAGTMSVTPAAVEIAPDANGTILLAMEDCLTDPVLRPVEDYPDNETCVASVKADFDGFCGKIMPKLPAEYEEARLQALWQTWNMIVDPDGQSDYVRPMVKMVHCIFEAAFGWQQPMQAIWLSRDPELSWQVFCSCFDFMDENGRLYDNVAFRSIPGGAGLKPPVQGWALLWLMEQGVYDGVPREERRWLLDKMIRWTEYFMNFRDKDGDGIFEYGSALETGWEDAPQYMTGFPNASPDLNAYLALQMEAIAEWGASCGMPEEERDAWRRRSQELIERITASFWDGEKWFSFNAATGERSANLNIALYTVLVLGKRLPQEIIDRSVRTIFSEGGFDTPYGLASEALSSVFFRGGFTRGSVITPAQFLMCMAFEACGYEDRAEKVARNYCRALKEHGFFHIYNALSGREDRSLTAFGERGLFWSAWTSSCYFFLADRYGK